jgi:glycosyltransferase involved in cell wall biosynthesis
VEKTKILHIIGAVGIGGCEKQLLGLCRRMDMSRFDLSLLWYSRTEDSLDSEFRAAGVDTIFVDKFSMPVWKFFWTMRNSVRRVSPDVVHTWLYSANFWGRWAAASCGVPHLVASYRDVLKRRKLLFLSYLGEKMLPGEKARLANSNSVARSIAKAFHIASRDIRVIHNAVSLDGDGPEQARQTIRRNLGLPDDEAIVLMVASQQEVKNYPMFIRAASLVCLDRERVTFVGVGRNDMVDELRTLAEECGCGEKVKFAGQQSDIRPWLAAADMFCLTSDSEGCPNALLEAMLAELPVVSSNFSSAEEIVANGRNGVLVPLNDHRAMAREIALLIEDKERARGLARCARETVIRDYSWEALTQEMEQFYSGLVGRNEQRDLVSE